MAETERRYCNLKTTYITVLIVFMTLTSHFKQNTMNKPSAKIDRGFSCYN